MKAPPSPRKFITASLFAIQIIAASPAWSADGTWLSASGTPAVGNGNWSAVGRWSGGILADGSGSTMTLQAPSGSVAPDSGASVGGYVINLDSNRTLQNITLAAGTWSSSQAYRITGGSNLLFAGGALPTISTVGTGAVLEIAPTSVSGNQGVRFQGAGRVLWNPGTMNLTGSFVINGAVEISRSAALGNVEVEMAGGGPRLWVKPSSTGMTLSNNIRLGVNAAQSAGFVWSDASAGVVTLSGSIYQGNTSFVSNVTYTSNTGSGAQRFKVTGNNSYKGTTVIGNAGSVLVMATTNTALGIGEDVAVTFGNSTAGLGLSGNVTIAKKTLTLNGSGYSGTGFDEVQWTGSLFNQSGTNQWSGAVQLGTTANPRIGVVADSKLIIGGVVSGAATGGLIKSGDGTLELSGSNSYSSGTTVTAGTLLVSNNKALGSGGLKVEANGNLSIQSGTVLSLSSIQLDSGSELTFSLSGLVNATGVIVSGNQLGTGIHEINILNGGGLTDGTYQLLTVEGAWSATGFQIGSMSDGYTGELKWQSGFLTLDVIAVPEPQSVVLIGSALLLSWAGVRANRKGRKILANV